MNSSCQPIRVLHSFPHRLGKPRIATTAWYEIDSVAGAGAEMLVMAGDMVRQFQRPVRVKKTLAWGRFRVPARIFGTRRFCALHDFLVARQLAALKGSIDLIHAWPMSALRTLRMAKQLGIPTVLERPNAHTRFAYEVVQKECAKLGVEMPPGHEHAFKADWLKIEEAEYDLADRLLCPSDFVARTFVKEGFPVNKLVRHQYGFDDKVFSPGKQNALDGHGLVILFVGGCAPRKGLHYALEAFLNSGAQERGTFLIAGEFIAAYQDKLSPMLNHPSVKVLGHRTDAPRLMRQSDILILPSIEEGSALVTSEARGCGCVLLVSEASGAICRHEENALVHQVGDVNALTRHIAKLDQDRAFLEKLRAASLQSVNEITWTAAGMKLHRAYHDLVTAQRSRISMENELETRSSQACDRAGIGCCKILCAGSDAGISPASFLGNDF